MLDKAKGDIGFKNASEIVGCTQGILRRGLKSRPPAVLKIGLSET